MIVALIALALALGGTGYAAVKLPKNSVGAAQLRRQAVTAAKVNANAITSAKVKDGSLLGQDFKAGQLPSGPPGPKGDKGDKGDPGPGGSLPVGEPGAFIGAGVVGNNGLANQVNKAGAAMTLQHPIAGKYVITVPGVALDGYRFAVTVTPMGNGNIPAFVDVDGFNGALIVWLRDTTKAPTDSDFSFQITRVASSS